MKKIQDFFTIYKQAAWEKDSKRMIDLYDDDVTIFDMWNKGYQNGLVGWSAVIEEWLGSLQAEENVNVIFEMIEAREGHDVAFASALITFQAIAADNIILRSMKNRITIGFIKRKDQWKVIHQHTSAPINSNLEGILNF